jgi:hypothetical protein
MLDLLQEYPVVLLKLTAEITSSIRKTGNDLLFGYKRLFLLASIRW